jgi:alginate production protein
MKGLPKPLLWLLSACLMLPGLAVTAELDGIVPGHWLEVRGELDEHGVFQAQRIHLIEPQDEEALIGHLSASSAEGEFELLGQAVQVSSKVRFRKLESDYLHNKWVKVQGHYRGPKRFSARTITARGPGRERITGQVSNISGSAGHYSLRIMNFDVRVSAELQLRHDKAIGEYTVVQRQIALLRNKEISEEDRFGGGIAISDKLRFTAMVETRYRGEDNYNLNDDEGEDRQDVAGSVRGRLVMDPSGYGISGQMEFRYTYLRRKDDHFDRFEDTDSRLGESFLFFNDPFDVDFDIQAGRMSFDDRREWVYDQNLDGVRFYWTMADWVAELSATTTLTDGKPRDENTNNYVAYFTDQKRRFAAYVVHRDTDFTREEKVTHIGVRAFGAWPDRHNSWLEVSHMSGSRDSESGNTQLRGWGLDIGTTREISRHWFLTGSWAYGQGDDNNKDGRDGNFRQTGLQDNNAKFAGVTSFRYYGELLDPELANLHIATLGLGYRFADTTSVDLVGHYYRQDKAIRRILDSNLDQKPNGIDPELGWEVDAIVGWQPNPSWDFEFVLGWFNPGKAFEQADDAWVSKLQLRYRY